MTAAPPPRDSVLDALGYAIRVLTKLEFLWAPFVLYVILLLPLLATPGLTGPPPTLTTQADVEAYFRGFVPVFVGSLVLGVVLGPVLSAVMYRLGQQFVDGEPAGPFGPGIAGLAWRFFLQTLVLFLFAFIAAFVWILAFVILQGTIGLVPAVLIAFLGGFVGLMYVALRLGLAPVLLLWGAGPIESFSKSWELTRGNMGRVLRWFIVSGLIIGLFGALLSAIVSAFFGSFGQAAVGQYLGTLLVAPVGLVTAIIQVLLARLLMSPPQVAPPPALPEWMHQTTPAAEPPPTPPAPASDGT
jgi:hypothetical protein